MMWIALTAGVLTLIVMVSVLASRRDTRDLGAVSTGWIAQHRDNPE